jgi:hypothetical protein
MTSEAVDEHDTADCQQLSCAVCDRVTFLLHVELLISFCSLTASLVNLCQCTAAKCAAGLQSRYVKGAMGRCATLGADSHHSAMS